MGFVPASLHIERHAYAGAAHALGRLRVEMQVELLLAEINIATAVDFNRRIQQAHVAAMHHAVFDYEICRQAPEWGLGRVTDRGGRNFTGQNGFKKVGHRSEIRAFDGTVRDVDFAFAIEVPDNLPWRIAVRGNVEADRPSPGDFLHSGDFSEEGLRLDARNLERLMK